MQSTYNEFGIFRPFEPGPLDQVANIDLWMDAWKCVPEEDIPELKGELETHFRNLLGVTVNNQRS